MLGRLLIRYLKPSRWLIVGVLVFQFLSVLATLYPALRAARIEPAEALRYD